MTNTATVIRLEGADKAAVRVTRGSACGNCGTCKGCDDPRAMVEVVAANPIGAEPGDRVVITTGTRQVLGLAALVYLLPVVLFLAGWAAVGWPGALAGVTVSGALVFWANRRLSRGGGVQAVITNFAGGAEA